jgi:hypothetical protein
VGNDDRRVAAVAGAGGAGALLVAAAVLLAAGEESGGPGRTVLACVPLGLAVVAFVWQLVVFVRLLRRRGAPGKHVYGERR